jgi:cyclopropane fatty-acyl-phospholipid synthase-like methyltransferase
VHVLDYQEMSHEQDGSFDRVMSIKMVEAIGLENVDVHWAAIDRVLKRKSAAGKEHGVCDSTVSPLHHTFFPPTSCVLL